MRSYYLGELEKNMVGFTRYLENKFRHKSVYSFKLMAAMVRSLRIIDQCNPEELTRKFMQ
jgi:hypothetical protein